MAKVVINKLPQDLVNQIAAGEVIERPASVVKELLDNSIDAESRNIKIKIIAGGCKSIEVADDGISIEKDNIALAFDSHATSKIHSIEDLNNLITMGFRGEALSTIKSVSEVTVTSKSKHEEKAYMVEIKNGVIGKPSVAARENGTTIRVDNIFYNLPARLKFLNSEDTEYKKILETLMPYFLVHPEIHFILERDKREIFNLPAVPGCIPGYLHPQRIKQVIKSEFVEELMDVYYDGEGMKVGGFIAHPSHNTDRTPYQYVFVNGRPVRDYGIIKSVLSGYSRYIPEGRRAPFFIKIDLNSNLVDVNVHPRKEEVRFANPYRIYAAVTKLVQDSLARHISESNRINQQVIGSSNTQDEIAFSRLRPQADSLRDRPIKEYSFGKPKIFEIQQSLEFSKNVLKDSESLAVEKVALSQEDIRSVHQIFNKYILIEFSNDELWVVDQHAAAERINYEKLMKRDFENNDVQHLLIDEVIELSELEMALIQEYLPILIKSGFKIVENKNGSITISSIPSHLVGADLKKLMNELLNNTDIIDAKKDLEKRKELILATIACHGSVRSGQPLSDEECISIVKFLLACENPYSCPHGRPAIWKLKLSEIDANFYRTY